MTVTVDRDWITAQLEALGAISSEPAPVVTRTQGPSRSFASAPLFGAITGLADVAAELAGAELAGGGGGGTGAGFLAADSVHVQSRSWSLRASASHCSAGPGERSPSEHITFCRGPLSVRTDSTRR